MNNADSSMLLKDFLSVVHGEVRKRLAPQNALTDSEVQFEETAFVEVFAG